MLNRRFAQLSLVLVTTLVAACSEPRGGRDTGDDDSCVDCHGSAQNGNAAPPPVRWDVDAAPDAHQIHLQAAADGIAHPAYACETCHVVPDDVADPQHIDDDDGAEVVFGALAVDEGVQPAFDRESATCGNTYCHGATLSGGNRTEVVWTAIGQNQAQCGSCHSLPPTEDHPRDLRCARCHGSVVDAGLNFISPELHADGTVQFAGTACDSCHGASGNPAPPPAIGGETATTEIAVGAHAQHLRDSDWHARVTCNQCHIVPTDPDQPGHWDTPQPAELVFGSVATANGTEATWNRDDATCSVYCHGVNVGAEDGSFVRPVWTQVGAGQADCGACHALPPGGDHPPREDCQSCHGAVVSGPASDPTTTFVAAELHVNGAVNVAELECNLCHGDRSATDLLDPASWAPPTDVHGGNDLTKVGAHQAHMAGAGWHAPVACASCHLVPPEVDSLGHIDPSPAELTFSGVAVARGASATYDAGTCTNYCHGPALGDPSARDTSPQWTDTALATPLCESCHGQPPTVNHPPRIDCDSCHPSVGQDHVDGEVDLVAEATCNLCHGDRTADSTQEASWAPPVDIRGGTDAQVVGAHQAHLTRTSSWHAVVLCVDCHAVPETLLAPGHMDGDNRAELTWSRLAVRDGAVPTYDAGTCTNYCHGSTLTGGSNTAPTWTAGATADTCGSCHGRPPASPHPQNPSCSTCHGTVVDADNETILRPDLHVNGVIDY